MTIEYYLFITKVQIVLFGLGFLLTLIRIRQRSKYMRVLGLLFLLSLSSDVAGFVLVEFKISPNYAQSIYYILSLPILSMIYYYVMRNPYKKLFILINIGYIVFALYNLFFLQKSSINSYSNIFQATILLIYSTYYFYWLITELPTTHLQTLPMFWINTGFMIYHAGNFFLYAFTTYLVNVLNNNLILYWTMHNMLGITECIILIVAVMVDLKNIKKQGNARDTIEQFGRAV